MIDDFPLGAALHGVVDLFKEIWFLVREFSTLSGFYFFQLKSVRRVRLLRRAELACSLDNLPPRLSWPRLQSLMMK